MTVLCGLVNTINMLYTSTHSLAIDIVVKSMDRDVASGEPGGTYILLASYGSGVRACLCAVITVDP